MKNKIEQAVKDDGQIAAIAYQLWEQAGRPSGRDLEFWFAAEAQARTIVKAPNPAPAAKLAPNASTKTVSRSTPAHDRRRSVAPSGASAPQRKQHSWGLAPATR